MTTTVASTTISSESPSLPNESGLREALEKLRNEYLETIEKYKEFSNNAYNNMNVKAAAMWDHKRSSYEQSVIHIRRILSQYPSPSQPDEKGQEEYINGLKKLLRMVDCPEILIENPELIHGQVPTEETLKWAERVVKKSNHL